MSKKIARPSSKPSPSDAPLVDQRARSRLGLGGRHAIVDRLRVDDDLGAGALLDGIDGGLGPDDRVRREDLRLVVHRPADLGLRERRAGLDDRGPRLLGRARWRRLERRLDDLRQRRREGVVEPPLGQQRQHRVVVDGLARFVREICVREPGAPVQLDLPVLPGRVQVEQDHEAVVDALAAHAPLVHQRLGVRLGLLGRDVVVVEVLRVHHDLGLRLGLDRVDDQLRAVARRRAEQLGRVVHGLAVDGVRERRTGRADRHRQGQRHGGDGHQPGQARCAADVALHGPEHIRAQPRAASEPRRRPSDRLPSAARSTCGGRGRPL